MGGSERFLGACNRCTDEQSVGESNPLIVGMCVFPVREGSSWVESRDTSGRPGTHEVPWAGSAALARPPS